jgi:hypothetical protein
MIRSFPSFTRKVRRPERAAQLHLEALEDRLALSPIFVTNLNDSGAGSLRNAINQADATSGAVVQFAPSLSGQINVLSELEITSSMTIVGNNKVTVDGGHATRDFHVASSAQQVIMQNFTIADGLANDPQGGGGGILDQGQALVLSGMIFNNNIASLSGTATGAAGGAVDDPSGFLDVESCFFKGNRAEFFSAVPVGGAPFVQAFGGAIATGDFFTYATTTAALRVINSEFKNNIAQGLNGGVGAGGAINGEHTAMTISGCTFFSNQALGGDAFSSNNDSGVEGGHGLGGGLRAGELSNATIDRCTFNSNTAHGGNGATVQDFTQFANPVGGLGGLAYGGGIDITFQSVGTVTNTNLFSNSAIGGNGGQGLAGVEGTNGGRGGAGGDGVGGDLNANSDSSFTATNVLCSGGLAQGGNGAFGDLTAGLGGFGEGGGFGTPRNSSGGSAVLTSVIFQGCVALGGISGTNNSGILDEFSGDGLGGGIWSGPMENLTLHSCNIQFCLAQGGAAVNNIGSAGLGLGGGLFISDGFFNNTVDTFIDANTVAAITGNHASTIDDNIFGVYISI